MRAKILRSLPAWIWRRPFGVLVGPFGALLLTLAITFFDRMVTAIPNPSLLYPFVILAFAYGWGGG